MTMTVDFMCIKPFLNRILLTQSKIWGGGWRKCGWLTDKLEREFQTRFFSRKTPIPHISKVMRGYHLVYLSCNSEMYVN